MTKFKLKKKAPIGYYTINQVAEYLHVSTRTVRRYIKDRGLKAVKPAGIILIEKKHLDQWVEENGEF